MAKNVSDHLVEMLKSAGVKRVYAITGDSLNPVNDAIRRDGSIEWIHVRHEETAAYAASMDAELNGIGCCMGSSGPGHVHLVNGLYDANRSGNPVIAIASTCATDKFGTEYFQETNPELLFKDCSKKIFMANTPKQFSTMIQRTIQTALNEKGVAVLGLPGDVASADFEDVTTGYKNFKNNPIFRPSESEMSQLIQLLNSDKKIAFFCGHGCKDAVKEVEELAGKLNAPIVYSFRGKIFFDRENSAYSVGMNGLLGNKSGYETCNEAEILLLLGTDFPYSEFLPADKVIIQIDEKPERIGRRAHVDYGFAGDIKDTVLALLPYIKSRSDDSFLKKMKKIYLDDEKRFTDYAEKKGTLSKINPEYIATLIDHYSSENAIYTVDTGMTAVWAARFIRAKGNRYLTGSFNHGSMANALPMAIGAAAASPDRQVIAMSGDGGLSMLLGDLAVVMQYQFPIKIFVFNNHSLGMVKLEMEVAGYVDWQTDMINPPFDKIAELMNIKGLELKDPEKAESVIREAFTHEGPVLVNIYTDPDTLAMPPHITFEQMKGFATSLAKKIGMGKFEDVKNSVKAGINQIGEVL
ncbi:thiamine pyrophosphate-binding protein [Chryseobacterium formosus]|uniref:Thiamine pyrophosphate-binding protein n=1 Tax=Chryseobacterium formosus TaxID=1537363 RepID=A0ABT3XVE8_9FLAO|nr:thiamine pyrophosphate-dependent enzyme [Chryseobacterium formosus]MCX8525593.1 thiamine pyrophosphate-binding protein [Chryseobacterium formosus]